MIVDYLEHYKTYTGLISELEEGLDFIEHIKNNGPGKYEGKDMFAIIEEGQTGDIGCRSFESHRNYIDVQYLVQGEEEICWESVEHLTVCTEYDNEKDITFYEGKGRTLQIKAGMVYILFASDGHKCGGEINQNSNAYRKIILKIKSKD